MSSYQWYYPKDIANDLQGIDLPAAVKAEVFACAWEYSRSVIPSYTNWARYVAFMRQVIPQVHTIIIIGTVAEFKGELFDMTVEGPVLGYDLDQVLDDLFQGTPGAQDMAREYKTFLTVTSDKTSERRHDELFWRYRRAVASSPQNWFRLRDCDALCRFTIAAALACNDLDHVWFSDEEFNILAELGDTMYDAIAFYKHRAEGETNNTFAYIPQDLRVDSYRTARELLWAFDVAFATKPEMQVVINFIRAFGGPIHMMMRRYRFVEEGLVIGKAEDDKVIQGAREHEKLWHRLERDDIRLSEGAQRLERIMEKEETLLFPGFATIISEAGRSDSPFELSMPTGKENGFGGSLSAKTVAEQWKKYALGLKNRVHRVFPQVNLNPVLPAF